jgi:hypothetical protein
LWECLHDGHVEEISSDAMLRTVSIVMDVSFHREFHELPENTRLKTVGEGIRILGAFEFEPWPGTAAQPVPEEQRRADAAKGRLISRSWLDSTAAIQGDENHFISNCEISLSGDSPLLNLGVVMYHDPHYVEVRIHAEQFRYFVGEQEMSLKQFQEFGSAYWSDWSAKSKQGNS